LIVDSGSQPSAAIRIDISAGLADVDQFEGRMLVRCKLRAIEVGQESTNVAAVSVVPAGEPATSPKGKRYYLTLSNAHAQWYDREVTTDAFNFKVHKVYLTFQVNWPGQSYGVDDVQVDLLPATEMVAAASRPGTARGPDPAALLAPPTEPPLFRQFDKNHDGRITREEMNPQSMNLFNLLDADHDGVVTLKEATDGTKALFGSRNTRRPGPR
jgi:hypothetical protein